MEHSQELPYDDRSPDDGALFPLDELILMQHPYQRIAHSHKIWKSVLGAWDRMRYIDIELAGEDSDLHSLEMMESSFRDWRFYIARDMSDEDLMAERRQSSDLVYRALGMIAICHRPEPLLRAGKTTIPPVPRW